jgi:tetratricopeptide (TPR) repeat protein/arylsulfatase A-like enzyme
VSISDLSPRRRRVLLLGWDAADWKIITPLLDRGEMPFLAQLVREGVMGNVATLTPALSPLLWTSIATGKRADKHGILGFAEPRPDGQGVQLASSKSRRCAALWNILPAYGRKPAFVHWYASHPAESVPGGVMVSDLQHQVTADNFESWKLPEECVQPPDLRPMMADLRMHPVEISAEQFQQLAPNAGKPGIEKDPRTMAITAALASFSTTHAVGTWLAEHGDWDLLSVYYRAPDDFCHDFMEYRAPKREDISHSDHLRWGDVVDNTYRMLDASLGRYMRLVGRDTTIVLVSDHGFESDHLRPRGTSGIRGTNPVGWHRQYGIFVAAGPCLKKDERVYGASLLDVAPTVLTILGLPVGADMEGHVLQTIFESPPEIKSVPTHDRPEVFSPGESPAPDPAAEQAALDQLIRLGYLPELPLATADQMRLVQIERLRALAQVHLGAHRPQEAMARLEELRKLAPDDRGALGMLISCQISAGQLEAAESNLAPILARSDDLGIWALVAGRLRAAQGRDDEALRYFEQARRHGDDNVAVLNSIGMTHLGRERWQLAAEIFREVLALDPDNAPGRTGLGVALQRQGKNEEAAEQLMRSVALLHQQSLAHHHLGLALRALGHEEWALRAFTYALQFHPANPEAHEQLAEIYTRLDQRAVALKHLQAAATLRKRMSGSA